MKIHLPKNSPVTYVSQAVVQHSTAELVNSLPVLPQEFSSSSGDIKMVCVPKSPIISPSQ